MLNSKVTKFSQVLIEELPTVMTQVIEEGIECEISNINIQHTDPVEVNMNIHLPLKDEKLVKLQESDPHINQLRKQWENKNLDQKHVHHGKQYPQTKTHQQWTIVHTHCSPQHAKGLPPHFGTQHTRTQWFQKNIRITEKQIPLERHEEISTPTLHKLPSLCKTQHQDTTTEE